MLSLICLASCNNSKVQENSNEFIEYLESYTQGSISCRENITITFNHDLAAYPGEPNSDASKKLITLSPKVSGTVRWLDARTIAFIADSPLKGNTTYSVSVAMNKLVESLAESNALFTFEVSTLKQSMRIANLSCRVYATENNSFNRLSGVLHTADYADEKSVEETVEIHLNNATQKIIWQHGGLEHNFYVDSIRRTESYQQAIISWDGKALGCEEIGSETLRIFPINVFGMVDYEVTQQPEQYISIRFSEPLLPSQDLDGIIRINNADELKYYINNDELLIYPQNHLVGENEVIILAGIQDINHKTLGEDIRLSALFEEIKPDIELIGKGTIMPSSAELTFPFSSVNLMAVDVRIIEIFSNNVQQFFQENSYSGNENISFVGRLIAKKKIDLSSTPFSDLKKWKTYHFNLAELITVNPGAIYRVQLSFTKEYSLYNQKDLPKLQALDAKAQLDANLQLQEEMNEWDTKRWYYDYDYDYDYKWEERDNPESKSYYNSSRFESKNIYATNLSIIAKGGNANSMFFATSNLVTAKPESGVTISVYNLQKQLLETVISDANGFARIELKNKPYFLIAEKDNQRCYLRLDDGSSLSLSNYDISGELIQNGIKGFIYGERGVWRPGDKMFINFILENAEGKFPSNYPIVFELVNPQGQITYRKVSSTHVDGFYCFMAETDVEAPTGIWEARVLLGQQIFRKNIKVETVKPNRLKVGLSLDKPTMSYRDQSSTVNLNTAWLHGGIANGLKADINLRFSQIATEFKNFPGYIFDDPTKELTSDEEVIFDGQVDNNGFATVKLPLPKINSAPGMLRANFTSRVFEKSGDFSISSFSTTYAPYTSFVGIKMPSIDSEMYKTDTNYPMQIVTVDELGQKVSVDKVKVTIYKINWRWWWDSSEDKLARYVDGSYASPVFSTVLSTKDGSASQNINIAYSSWRDNGRYLIHVENLTSGHSTATVAYFSRWGYWGDENEQNAATRLHFKTNKKTYLVGEEVEVTIPSGKNGQALVSIENGSKVLDAFWISTQENNTSFKFKITPNMAPNVFLHISLIQPHAQTENDAPMRLYGVVPIMVENKATHLIPEIIVPEKIEPESLYTIKVKEQNGQKMTYTLAVVDDGLLDLTNFKTPSPWETFYAREALGVKTWDFYDNVIGAFGTQLERAFAVGGDGNNGNPQAKKANRFKPVVSFIGPFTLEKGKTNEHRLSMSNYVGSVRVMVVAAHNRAYGNAEKTVRVAKPLMLLATLPRVLGPQEEVSLPVNIFALEPNLKTVQLSVKTNDMLSLVGDDTKQVSFNQVGDQIINFKLRAASKIGIAKVSITAQSGKHTAKYDIEIDIRPSSPRVTNVMEKVIEPNASWNDYITAPGVDGTNDVKVELSAMPPINLAKRLEYLINYPHGCIEQTTSAVFPQLMLHKLTLLDQKQHSTVQSNIRAALQKMPAFQTGNGGFAYWTGGFEASEWGTNYAGHFMILAEENGYALPIGLKQKWIEYQKTQARNWSSNAPEEILNQAYRLYTLALAKSPDYGAMNRLKEQKNLSQPAKWRLATSYLLIGKPEVANQIISEPASEIKYDPCNSSSFGSETRDKAMMLETLVLMQKNTEAFKLLQELSKELSGPNWMSTQTSGYAIFAVSQFASSGSAQSSIVGEVKIANGSPTSVNSKASIYQQKVDLAGQTKTPFQVKNNTGKIMYAQIIASGIPAFSDTTSAQNNLSIAVKYVDTQNQTINPRSIVQGTDFIAQIKVSNLSSSKTYRNLALTAMFPSGWEILNDRITNDESNNKSTITYQDFRDDRVHSYFDLEAHESKSVYIKLNAAYEGKFFQPIIQCEAMYDNAINARTPGQWISVIKQ